MPWKGESNVGCDAPSAADQVEASAEGARDWEREKRDSGEREESTVSEMCVLHPVCGVRWNTRPTPRKPYIDDESNQSDHEPVERKLAEGYTSDGV